MNLKSNFIDETLTEYEGLKLAKIFLTYKNNPKKAGRIIGKSQIKFIKILFPYSSDFKDMEPIINKEYTKFLTNFGISLIKEIIKMLNSKNPKEFNNIKYSCIMFKSMILEIDKEIKKNGKNK
jgi:hypothetical protein